MPATATLAEQLAVRTYAFYEGRRALAAELCGQATAYLLDLLGNALGGSAAESSRRLRAGLAHVPPGEATVIGGRALALPEYAALLNGAASHALEMDDTHQPSSTHPGAVVIPAALAAAEATDATGRDLLAAIVAGYEVMTRVGMALGPAEVYARGFHPTAVCGPFGAAAAVGLILGADPGQIASAFGIAGSQAGGLQAYLGDGSLLKRLHPGWAAHGGTIAARLALAGFSGPRAVFEDAHGLFHAFSGAARPEPLLDDWSHPELLRTSSKAHACCRYNQAPLDALLQCMREGGVQAEDVEAVELGVLSVAWNVIAAPRERKLDPHTVVDAQFSLPYGAAVALRFGRAGVAEHREELLRDPAVQALLPRVHCVRDASLDAEYPARWPATARLQTRDGREFHARVEFPKGDPENPLTPAELEAKFRALAGMALPPERLNAIVRLVTELDAAPSVRHLLAALGATVGAA
ncbi:MAG TPA: MmgE/PrpD family protein [Dehalococcoidia bacterium]|nr:MmgE/PrpD family protein [Dehalococcoidia bacterium]